MAADFLGGVGEVIGWGQLFDVGLFEQLAGALDVGALQTHHHRHLEADLLGGGDQGLCDRVTLGDTTEDVDQHALDLGVSQNDPEGFGGTLGGDGTADVEEVGRLAAVQLDDVHGGHGQTGPVDQAADVAIESDIGQVEFLGPQLGLVLLRRVVHPLQIAVPEDGGVVEVHLGVNGQYLTLGGADQWVDLRQ